MSADAAPTPLQRTRTRPTRRLVIVTGLGVVLWAAGTGVAAGYVVIVAALLVASGPWAFVAARRAARSIVVQRVLPRTAVAGAPVTIELRVRAAAVAALVVHDLTLDTVAVVEDPRAGLRVSGPVVLRRGIVAGGAVRVEAADPFGLFSVTAEGEAGGEALVVPAPADVRRVDLSSSWAVEAGDKASRSGGGPEVIGTRDYHFGDAARTVHWRSSARRGQLVVRQYAEESRPDVRLDVGAGTWDQAALDRTCEAIAGIAEDARHHGHAVRLGVDATVVPWARDTLEVLAGLAPAAGVPVRELRGVPPTDAAITVTFAPSSAGAEVVVERGGERLRLGLLPSAGGPADVATWLHAALDAS